MLQDIQKFVEFVHWDVKIYSILPETLWNSITLFMLVSFYSFSRASCKYHYDDFCFRMGFYTISKILFQNEDYHKGSKLFKRCEEHVHPGLSEMVRARLGSSRLVGLIRLVQARPGSSRLFGLIGLVHDMVTLCIVSLCSWLSYKSPWISILAHCVHQHRNYFYMKNPQQKINLMVSTKLNF